MMRTFLLAIALTGSAHAEQSRSLDEKYRVCQQFVGEQLAREMTRQHGEGEAPTRYLVAESVEEMLEVLDNLSVLAGQGPVVPIQSDPDIYFRRTSNEAASTYK